jgi:23S rRNA (uracil1939-C5)-methyltransferase
MYFPAFIRGLNCLIPVERISCYYLLPDDLSFVQGENRHRIRLDEEVRILDSPFDLQLKNMAHGGSAMGRHDKRVIFVPYALPGERIRARIVDQKKNFARAEVVEILEPSPHRIEPRCPHFGPGKCGGCHWQHIDYQQQLIYKRDVVIDQLKRLGKFDNPVVQPTIPSPDPWGYRGYVTFTRTRDGQLGFYSDDNRRIIPIETCHIMHPALLELYEQLDLGDAEVGRVKFQVGSDPEDRMLIIQTPDNLAPEIEVDFPISINLLLSDNEPVNLIGSPQVSYQIFNRKFRVTAGGFFQVNRRVAEILVDQVLSRLELQGGETILDLYSGVGLLTAFIAERSELVISVESYPPAVTDADENLADLENVDLVEGAVEDVLGDLDGPFDGIVVDPPRTGLSPQVIEQLARLDAPRVIYVSCDPATFSRDARQFSQHGYALIDVQPIDMFPQTYHIECVATLRRID